MKNKKHQSNTQLNLETANSWIQEWNKEPAHCLASNLIYNIGISAAAMCPKTDFDQTYDFVIDLPTQTAVSQFASGRCWLFAATNLMRESISQELEIDNFELSQSYLAFWDKFERANFFLESIIDTLDKPLTDRYVYFFLTNGIADGGQWDMAKNVVEKYGVVPKSVFPDAFNSANTHDLNFLINWILRDGAYQLRKMVNCSLEEIQQTKETILHNVFKVLLTCYGKLPETFDFTYTVKQINEKSNDSVYKYQKVKYVDQGLTPLSFYQKYVKTKLTNYVSLINAPTQQKPLYRRYSFKYLNNVIDGAPIMHYNVSINVLKYLAVKSLVDKKPLWFGADVSFYGNRTTGTWDDKAFDYQTLLGSPFELTSKADELNFRAASMNHAMLITGLDLNLEAFNQFETKLAQLQPNKVLDFIDQNFDSVKITKWKIENSWGTNIGNNGYFMMSDSWFNKYVFQLIIERQYLDKFQKLAQINSFDEPAINLEPWDPIGTLA